MAKEENTPPKKGLTRNSLSYWVIISTAMTAAGLVTVVILGVLFFAPEMLPINPPPPPAVAEQVDALSSQVAQLNTKVQQIDQKNQAMKPGVIQNRLSSLEARLNELSGSTTKMQDVIKGLSEIRQNFQNDGNIVESVTRMSKLVTTLDSRVETLQSQNESLQSNLAELNPDDIKAANMLLVATQFQGSVDRGLPFAQELEAIKAVFNTDEATLAELDRLSPFAGQGVPSKEALSEELDSLSNDLIKAALAGDRKTVRNTVKDKLNKYVKIYQENSGLPLEDTQAILRRARNSLDRGDVNGAIIALSEIRGPTATLIEPFFNEAKAHALAEKLSKRVSDQAIDFIRDANIGPKSNTSSKDLF